MSELSLAIADFNLAHRIEAKSPVCGLGFLFLEQAGIRSGIRARALHSSRYPSSAANNVLAKPNFSVFDAM